MRRPGISLNLRPINYRGLADLGNQVVENMTGNSHFSSPSPALNDITMAVNSVTVALAKRGDAHNHGSTFDVIELRKQAITLHNLLTAEAKYIMCRAQLASGSDYNLMATIISGSGFSLRRLKTPQGLVNPVRNLRRFLSRSLSANQAKLKWQQPEGVTSRHNVKSYIVYRSLIPDFNTAMPIAAISKAQFIDINKTDDIVTYYYWVVPIGAAGRGALSTMLMITMSSL